MAKINAAVAVEFHHGSGCSEKRDLMVAFLCFLLKSFFLPHETTIPGAEGENADVHRQMGERPKSKWTKRESKTKMLGGPDRNRTGTLCVIDSCSTVKLRARNPPSIYKYTLNNILLNAGDSDLLVEC